MSALKSECRKFSPNMFNKTKCQNCFRTKDAHSAEALENNRASRNVSKCGYLFVAPDWDFNVSVNRTKRWQRRWFVLYDDGELTYALDEFPDTIPQGTIDMNKVLDVSDAEGVTGNDFAIAITAPDKVLFVKGTSREESKWWFDVLSRVLPRHVARGKHKRNATFPCGKATIPPPAVISQDYCSEDDLRLRNFSRAKFLSSSDIRRSDEKDWPNLDVDEDVFPEDSAHESDGQRNVEVNNALNRLDLVSESTNGDDDGLQQEHVPEKNVQNEGGPHPEEADVRRKNRRYLKRENRVQRNQRSRFDGVSKMIPAKNRQDKTSAAVATDAQSTSAPTLAAADKQEYLEAILGQRDGPTTRSDSADEKQPVPSTADTLSPMSRVGHQPTKTNLRKSESLKNIPSEAHSEARDGLRRYHSFRGSPSQRKTKSSSASNHPKNKSPSPKPTKASPALSGNESAAEKNANIHVQDPPPLEMGDEPRTEGAFTRTGWLMRLTPTEEWSRHWYVLRDSSLSYYRDPSAEHCGIMDGILDLNQVGSIRDADSDKHFAFRLMTWDGKKHTLAAETDELRRLWVQAIQYASNLWSLASKEDFIRSEIVLPQHHFHHRTSSPPVLPPSSPDGDDKRTSETSSSSDDQSEYFSLVDEDEDTLCSIRRDEDIEATLSISDSCIQRIPESLSVCEESDTPHGETFDDPSFSSESLTARLHSSGYVFDTPESADGFVTPAVNDASNDGCYVCVKVRSRLIAAKEEIRRLKNELREAHANFDNLEMFSYKLKQDIKSKEEDYDAQIALMSAKIDDLTSKFSLAERNYRQLKQKIAKGDYRLEKRKSSLKNKETLSLSKECESKLSELEHKIVCIESSLRKEPPEAGEPQIAKSTGANSKDSDQRPVSDETYENNKGILSRLQNLGEKVGQVGNIVSEKTENSRNPKICVQLRESEEGSCSLDESDDWRTFSLPNNTSYSHRMSEESVCDSPRNLFECQSLFAQKINRLLEWFKGSLDHLCKQENDTGSTPDKKGLRMANINEVMDYLYYSMPDEVRRSGIKSICYTILLLIEVIKVMERVETSENVEFLTKFNITGWAFRIIGKTLCIAFTDSSKPDLSNVLNMVSDIPQIGYFCPLMDKLLSKREQSVNNVRDDRDRLQQFTDRHTYVVNLLEEAKNARFKSLWDTLSEVPVQDSGAPNLQKENPMFTYVTSICTSIFGIAKSQLSVGLNHSLYILKSEHDALHSWCTDVRQDLEYSLENFLEELKERCPMINESSIPMTELGPSTFKEITCLVSQLSFLYVCSVILETTFAHLNKSGKNACKSCVPYETWISSLQKNYLYKTNCISDEDFFECSQCTLLNCLLSPSTKEVNWVGYLQTDSHFPIRGDCFGFEVEQLQNALNRASLNSSTIFPDVGKLIKDDCDGRVCPKCERLQARLDSSQEQHELKILEMEQNFRLNIETVEQQLQENNETHLQEIRDKEEKLKCIRDQLRRMKIEYEEQIQNLKNLYEQELNTEHENIDEDTIRQMYKAEIEDIKSMFKRGLVAIQNSHNRITAEMEKRHKDEMALLEAEKQKALELEAQATVTALEAIKKFHAKQLVEETANIKEELISKFQAAGQCEDFYCKYGNELEELKAEILCMAEKYSSKCQESLALEAKVATLRQKLKEAHSELSGLLNQNPVVDLSPSQN